MERKVQCTCLKARFPLIPILLLVDTQKRPRKKRRLLDNCLLSWQVGCWQLCTCAGSDWLSCIVYLKPLYCKDTQSAPGFTISTACISWHHLTHRNIAVPMLMDSTCSHALRCRPIARVCVSAYFWSACLCAHSAQTPLQTWCNSPRHHLQKSVRLINSRGPSQAED